VLRHSYGSWKGLRLALAHLRQYGSFVHSGRVCPRLVHRVHLGMLSAGSGRPAAGRGGSGKTAAGGAGSGRPAGGGPGSGGTGGGAAGAGSGRPPAGRSGIGRATMGARGTGRGRKAEPGPGIGRKAEAGPGIGRKAEAGPGAGAKERCLSLRNPRFVLPLARCFGSGRGRTGRALPERCLSLRNPRFVLPLARCFGSAPTAAPSEHGRLGEGSEGSDLAAKLRSKASAGHCHSCGVACGTVRTCPSQRHNRKPSKQQKQQKRSGLPEAFACGVSSTHGRAEE